MNITAENVAEKYGITREQQDAFALKSQQRAAAAIAAGHFKSQIVLIKIPSRKGTSIFNTDEYSKSDTTLESLGKLRPTFRKEGGTVTVGNASGINDGATTCVLMESGAAARAGVRPLARLVSYGIAGVDRSLMSIGSIVMVQLASKRAGLSLNDMDVIGSNEAFSA